MSKCVVTVQVDKEVVGEKYMQLTLENGIEKLATKAFNVGLNLNWYTLTIDRVPQTTNSCVYTFRCDYAFNN